MTKIKQVTTLLLIYSIASFATADDFSDKKQRIVDRIGARISILQTFQSCVQTASNKDALKVCRTNKKEAMKRLKESRKK